MRTAATPRAPPGSSSSVRWVSAVPLVLARPHPPALSVLCRAWRFGGTVPLFHPSCPTLFRVFVRGLSAGLSPPGSRRRVCRRVCRHRGAFGDPFVLARPSPPSPGVVSAYLVSWRYRCNFSHPYPPALFVSSFGRVSAAAGGRRGFRSPHEASSCAARNRDKGLLCLRPRAGDPSCVPVRSINRCYVAILTAGASAGASRRLTPPPSDGGQCNIYAYLTYNQSDTKESAACDNLTYRRRSRSGPSTCLRRGRRLAPPASIVYICHTSSRGPDVPVSETL